MKSSEKCVAVIPCLNEASAIFPLVTAVKLHLPHVIVIDDGSLDATAQLAREAGAEVIRHSQSLGKGASLNAAWRRARELDFSWALSLDGDGQHSPDDIPQFLAALRAGDADLAIGNRFADPGRMPWLRRCVNQWMSRCLSRAAGIPLPDSQCGFRLMNLNVWSALPQSLGADHFEIESQILLSFARRGRRIKFIPIRTIYADECSKINPVRDTWRWVRWWIRANKS